MIPNNLDVVFNYEEDKIVMHSIINGEPIRANEIYFKILGQEFIGHFEISGKTPAKDRKRKYAELFGKKLAEIGYMIERQATHGKPMKMWKNGKTIISF